MVEVEKEAEIKSNSWFLYLIITSCVVVILSSFYFFYLKNDFDFIVETTCDPSQETCFHRDCTNPEDCPPNGLSDFKRYTLNAGDFKLCENEDCTSMCNSGVIKCELLECIEDPIYGETCTSPEMYNEVKVEVETEIAE